MGCPSDITVAHASASRVGTPADVSAFEMTGTVNQL